MDGVKQNELNLFDYMRSSKLDELSCFTVAKKTIAIIRSCLIEISFEDPDAVIQRLRHLGRDVLNLLSDEMIVANIFRRVIMLVREEIASIKGTPALDKVYSLKKMMGRTPTNSICGCPVSLKDNLVAALNDFELELETGADSIADQSVEHINNGDLVLVFGYSRTVEVFLKSCAKHRSFKVICIEGAPRLNGHRMAAALVSANIPTTLMSDSAVFAVMPNVSKVIVGTHIILANGGLKAQCGLHTVALTAKYCSVPVIVCASLYKISPNYLCSYNQDSFNRLGDPYAIAMPTVISTHKNLLNASTTDQALHICNPEYDYVPPELVSLYITNMGPNSPSQFYKLTSELYHPDDRVL